MVEFFMSGLLNALDGPAILLDAGGSRSGDWRSERSVTTTAKETVQVPRRVDLTIRKLKHDPDIAGKLDVAATGRR
jgi:hypothetical protein